FVLILYPSAFILRGSARQSLAPPDHLLGELRKLAHLAADSIRRPQRLDGLVRGSARQPFQPLGGAGGGFQPLLHRSGPRLGQQTVLKSQQFRVARRPIFFWTWIGHVLAPGRAGEWSGW